MQLIVNMPIETPDTQDGEGISSRYLAEKIVEEELLLQQRPLMARMIIA